MTIQNMTAAEAVKQSERQDEIVHIVGSESVHGDLLAECDDSAESGADDAGREITEYWGESWRVHVHG